jgi:hypothetical protein
VGTPRRRPGRPGIQLEDVLAAADALVSEGAKPTIERVRQRLGGGSPNTVSAMLDEWFAQLPARLVGAQPAGLPREDEAPLSVTQAAQQFWEVARREADKVHLQKTEAIRRELELQREGVVQAQADLRQRETSFEQARAKLDEALAASKQALCAMQEQMGPSAARIRTAPGRIRGRSAASEKSTRRSGGKQGGAARAGNHGARCQAARRRGCRGASSRTGAAAPVRDRSRAHGYKPRHGRVRQGAEGTRSGSGIRPDRPAFCATGDEEKSARRQADANAAHTLQNAQIELATLRERAAAADKRVSDLVSQLQRQQQHAEREISQIRESQATTAAVLRQIEGGLQKPSQAGPHTRKTTKKPRHG